MRISDWSSDVCSSDLTWSAFKGRLAGSNPWRATTLEWQTPETPPGHGNWGPKLPVVHRWAYDYSVPGAAQDFLPQNMPPEEVPMEGARADVPRGAAQPAAE